MNIKYVLELYSKETDISFRETRYMVIKTRMIQISPGRNEGIPRLAML